MMKRHQSTTVYTQNNNVHVCPCLCVFLLRPLSQDLRITVQPGTYITPHPHHRTPHLSLSPPDTPPLHTLRPALTEPPPSHPTFILIPVTFSLCLFLSKVNRPAFRG